MALLKSKNRFVNIFNGLAEGLFVEGGGNLLGTLGGSDPPGIIIHHGVDGIQEFFGTGIFVAVFTLFQHISPWVSLVEALTKISPSW